ncbi:MAG: methylmalonyl-CoA epimerase [Candidatus Rokubacteria bacterium]|nr:methylmalonyl-CoA epimerase [Candidatus Rokubacteria bacterium]
MITKIHHVGIVVSRLQTAYRFWRDALGLPLVKEAELPDQGVRAALLAAGESEVELLEPTTGDSGVGRFLARHGERLHHLCFESADVDAALEILRTQNVPLLDRTPRPGLAGRIAFLHPAAADGVLVELATPALATPPPPSPVRLKRLVIGCVDPHATAKRYQELFGLPEVAINGGARAMLGWTGGGTLLLVPAGEVGGMAGMVALSMVAPEMPALVERLHAHGVAMAAGANELTVEPQSCHGVHLHISRYHFP